MHLGSKCEAHALYLLEKSLVFVDWWHGEDSIQILELLSQPLWSHSSSHDPLPRGSE